MSAASGRRRDAGVGEAFWSEAAGSRAKTREATIPSGLDLQTPISHCSGTSRVETEVRARQISRPTLSDRILLAFERTSRMLNIGRSTESGRGSSPADRGIGSEGRGSGEVLSDLGDRFREVGELLEYQGHRLRAEGWEICPERLEGGRPAGVRHQSRGIAAKTVGREWTLRHNKRIGKNLH